MLAQKDNANLKKTIRSRRSTGSTRSKKAGRNPAIAEPPRHEGFAFAAAGCYFGGVEVRDVCLGRSPHSGP